MPAPLVAAIVRGVASQGIKKGIVQGAKQFAKDKIKDVAKEKAKSFIKNKKDKDGGLVKKSDDGGSGGGFFGGGGSGGRGGGGGGSLIKSKKIDVNKLSLISNEKNDGSDKKDQSKPFTGEELIQELNKIKDNLVKLKEISSNNLANSIKNNSLLRKQREKAKRDKKEEKLESNKKGSEKPKSTKGVKGPGFLDLIWGFISNVLLGSLVVFLLKHAPTIIRMFEDIAKGLQNPLYTLKIGITTLTTLFPRQIRFLASVTRKILGPPARLIGKLLLKASNVLGNLLKKAGIAILNLVKNPIKNLAKRILGQAGTQSARSVGQFVSKKAAPAAAKVAGKAVGAAGKALNVVKRLKFLSRALKNVHVVGALIAIGIDLALGERIDRAIAGAVGSGFGAIAGSVLGGAVGGAVGSVVPFAGTLIGIAAGKTIGGFLGSAVGDWVGKEVYNRLSPIGKKADEEAPVDQKYAAGRIGSTVAAARSQGRSGQNPQAPPSDSSTKLSGQTQENAEKNIFKDEKHLNVFSEIREKLRTSSFVGELLQLGADMAIGEKVNKTRTDIAAQQIGSSIGRALSENELQVFGFNKKLIGPFSEELTKWAKGKIFKDLTSISFPSYDKAKEESSSSGGTTSDQPGQPGSGVEPGTAGGAIAASDLYKRIGANAEQWDIFRNSLALIESKGDYKVFGGSGKHYDGRYQMGEAAKKDGSKFAGVPFPGHSSDPNAPVRVSFRNNPELQETIFTGYTLANHNYLMGNPKYKSANIERKLQVLGYAHNQGMGGADNWLNTGVVGADGFGTKGTKYTDLIAANFRAKKSGGNLQLAQGAVAVPSTSHGSSPPGGGGSGSLGLSNPTPNSSPGVRGSSGYASDSGLDILGKTGDQIVAPASGTLQYAETGHTSWKDDSNPGKSGYQPQHSFLIELSKPFKYEGKTIKYSYGTHLSSLSSSVQNKSGIQIKAGEPIGAMGVANKVPHLHLGLLQNRAQSSESDWLSNVQVKNALLSNKGGGRGNGGPVKKHKASEFILGGGRVLTSGMGMRDFALSPGMHMGVDIHGKTGEPLQAFSDGVVQDTGYEPGGYGNWVSWIDDNGIGHFYAHMNKPAFVRKGQRIKKGTILGELGSTGRSSGPHLHWETATNPSDTGRSKSAVLSRFNPLSKYGIDAPFGGTIQPDPSMATQGPPGASPGSPGASPGSPGASSEPSKTIIDPNFKIEGSKVKEFYLQALRDGTYTGKPQNMQSVSQRTDSIMQTPAYANNGGNNVLVMPMGGSSPQQSMPSGGGVNSGGGFVGSGDLDNYNKSLNQIIVSSFYKI